MSWRFAAAFLGLVILIEPAWSQRIFPWRKKAAAEINNIADPDPLPVGALARLGTLRLRHDQAALLGFSLDGKHLFSLGQNNAFAVWSAEDGRELRRFSKADIKTNNPNHHWSRAREMIMWQGRFLQQHLENDTPQPYGAVTEDGRYLAAASPKKGLVIWDTVAGVEVRRLAGKYSPPVAFSKDGSQVAALIQGDGESAVSVWDWKTGKELKRLKNPPARGVAKLQFSPDGKWLAGKDALFVRVWDLETGKRIRLYASIHGSLTDFSFSPDGRWLAGPCQSGPILIWDTSANEEAGRIAEQDNRYTAVAFAPDGLTLAAADHQHHVSVWQWRENKLLRKWDAGQLVQSLAWSPQSKTIIGACADGILRRWEAGTGEEKTLPRLPEIARLSFGEADQLTLIGAQGEVIQVAWKSGQVRAWKDRYSSEGYLLGAYAPTGVIAWALPDHSSGGVKATLAVPLQAATMLELECMPSSNQGLFSSDGRLFAYCDHKDDALKILKVDGGKVLRRLDMDTALHMAFSRDGTMLAALDSDHEAHLWEIASGQRRAHFPTTQSHLHAFAFAPNGRLLAGACQDETVRLWDAASGKGLHIFVGHRGAVQALAFSPNGHILASGGADGVIRLWSVGDGKSLGRFDGHRGQVNTLVFSNDGKQLASASQDTTVMIWDVDKAVQAATVTENRDLDSLWVELADADASTAYRAAAQLTQRPEEAIRLFRARIAPAAAVKLEMIQGLLHDLNHDKYPTREKATKALEQLDTQAEPFLLKALQDKPGVESAKRLQHLIECLENPVRDAEKLRQQRAVEVLERIGTPAAQSLLSEWSQGAADACLTQLAQQASRRLKQR